MPSPRKHKQVEEADPEEIREWAADLKDAFLYCRIYGHNWKPYAVKRFVRSRALIQTIRCARCKKRRHIEMTEEGHQVRSAYDNVPGYDRKGAGRITADLKGILRIEAIGRQTVIDVDEEEE